jgi:hypothetical protein
VLAPGARPVTTEDIVRQADRTRRCQEPDEKFTLWVDWLAIEVAKLIPAVHVRRRDLVPLVRLEGKRPRVVEARLVSRLDGAEYVERAKAIFVPSTDAMGMLLPAAPPLARIRCAFVISQSGTFVSSICIGKPGITEAILV